MAIVNQFFLAQVHVFLVINLEEITSSSRSSNMNSVVHTRGLDPVSFSFHKTVLFLQLFAV